MRRVYTDERFPNCEIVNDGSLTFQVVCRGKVVQTFTTRMPHGVTQLPEPVAQRRAQDYFERWANMDIRGELRNEVETARPRRANPATPAQPAAPNVTTTIDNLLAKEKLETDPRKKKALQDRILDLMQQEGSVAVAVVNELIAG